MKVAEYEEAQKFLDDRIVDLEKMDCPNAVNMVKADKVRLASKFLEGDDPNGK